MSFSNPVSAISSAVTRAIARRKGGAEPSADAAAAYQSAVTRYDAALDTLTVASVRVSAGRPSAADRKAHAAAEAEYRAASRAWTPAYAAWCLSLAAAAPAKTAKTLTGITDYEDQVQGSLRALKPFTHSEAPSIHPLNLILYGPPGTGKTWHAVTRAVAIVENRDVSEAERDDREDRAAVKGRFDELRAADRVAMVTFHQNTTYEEFIEGIRPVLGAAAGDVRYELSRGVFRRIAERAQEDPAGRYVLIIDEINRGNVARIFGELITLIEDSKRIGRDDEARAILPGSKDDFGVPANLHVVGTMNTADRSIALLDTALRRRFVFEERMPDPNHPLVSPDAGGVDCRKLLAAMNDRIAALLDREHRIGHTYFLRVDSVEALAETFRTRIVPLLQEYFYDDWRRVRAVLNWNGFVKEEPSPKELLDADLVDDHQVMYELLPADDPRWNDPRAYRRIYEPKEQAGPAEDSSEARND